MEKKILRTQSGRAGALAAVFGLAVTLTGCSMFPMSKADAGKKYLSILCPTNAASEVFNAAASSQDLEAIKAAAQELATTQRTAAKQLTDDSINWPGEVAEADRQTMADHYFANISWLNSVASASAIGDLPARVPTDDGFGKASQRIRAGLDLSTDTSVGCE
ncbi:MAG: hypothetical protein JSS74_11515 [Actinobacteria bacterium]|nr:hypothetical protein [Actinomycetota bacterium]